MCRPKHQEPRFTFPEQNPIVSPTSEWFALFMTAKATPQVPESTPPRPSIVRRHPLATGIAAAAVAVVLVSGLTAWGVGAAVTASLTSSTSSMQSMPAMPSTPATTGMSTRQQRAVRAIIDTIDGDTWTVTTRKGQAVTVTIDAATKFGTKKVTATGSDFAKGDSVVVIAAKPTDGTASDQTSIIAMRIVKAKAPLSDSTTP